MNERKFKCKLEEVPSITDALIDSLRKDLDEFTGYSPQFYISFIDNMVVKRDQCNALVNSGSLTKEIKAITSRILTLSKDLGVKVNRLDNYIKMAGTALDVAVTDMGVSAVRHELGKGNSEGAVSCTRNLMRSINRNSDVLETVGLKQEFASEVTSLNEEISSLNARQNSKISERNRLTDSNRGIFNELWDLNVLVMNTGKALYKGVDDVKLKDYTLTVLMSRINAEGKRDNPNPDAAQK